MDENVVGALFVVVLQRVAFAAPLCRIGSLRFTVGSC